MGASGCNLQAHLTKEAEIATGCISIGAILVVTGFGSDLGWKNVPSVC